MADDVNEQVFNEKQLYTGDVIGEDEGDGRASIPYTLPGIAPNGVAAENASAAKSSTSGRERRRKRASVRATQIVYWLESKYDILFEVCASLPNWKEAPSMTYDFDLLWCDQSIAADRLMKLKLYQKMNHFVGMSSITRKNNLGRNLLRMRKQFPTEYKFFPDTWILPTDLSDFKLQFTPAKNKTFIIKPDNGCQGKGIFLIRDGDKVPVDFSTTYVAQRYIHRPFLLDGHKFDLRLYVLVMGCDPLRIFLHKRGLVRLASEQYVEPTVKNLGGLTIHLTNYAINKLNPNFEENTNPEDAQDGHKRSWEAVLEFLRDQNLDVDTMMMEIEDLIIKTLIAVQPSLSHFYHSCQPDDVENSMCFEILGFDVMLDHRLQPWLIEVNHAPSFATESELDRVVKHEVLCDTFALLNLCPETRRRHKREAREKMEQRAMGVAKKQSLEERSQEEHYAAVERTSWEDARLNGYKRLYPSEAREREYAHIHDSAIAIWEMLMGGNSRRSVRLTQEPEVPDERPNEKSRKGDSDPTRGGDHAPGNVRERRSADEMREVVERLSAGCSARPRESCKSRRRGSKPDSATVQSEGTVSTAASTEDVAEGDGGDDVHKADSKTEADGKQANLPRPEVQVGDVIKVQTNLGWENVTVKAKRTNGKIDIQFKDGEYMRSVLPRILRESVPDRSGENAEKGGEKNDDKEASGGTHQASSGSTAPASSSTSLPKTARTSTSTNPSSSLSASTSKVAPLPPTCSPIDHARGGWPATAAPAAAATGTGALAGAGKEAPFSAAATVASASGVFAAAASVIAGTLATVDLGQASSMHNRGPPSASAATAGIVGTPPPEDEVINSLSSLTSNDRGMILAQLHKQRARASNGEPIPGPAPTPLPVAVSTPLQGQPLGGGGRGSGLRGAPAQTTSGIGATVFPQEVHRGVHEVRLRNHLQQLISVRPIVTRRNAGGADEAPKSPRSAARRQSNNSYSTQR